MSINTQEGAEMVRGGLAVQVEDHLERMLYSNELPPCGVLPPEQRLAKHFGVCRGTVREAMRRLAARGLVVTHPGRQARMVVKDEAVTLENLSLTVHERNPRDPERWRLVEGFFELKREVTVEVLAACCEKANERELNQVESACFALWEAAKWKDEPEAWASKEFEVLRLAARAANRPGQQLLLQSVERGYWALARWMRPRQDAKAVEEWALSAMHALGERNVKAVREELPGLLKASEAPLWRSLHGPSKPEDTGPVPPEAEAKDNLSDSRTGWADATPGQPPHEEAPSPAEAAFNGDAEPGSATQAPSWVRAGPDLSDSRTSPPDASPAAPASEMEVAAVALALGNAEQEPPRAEAEDNLSDNRTSPADALPAAPPPGVAAVDDGPVPEHSGQGLPWEAGGINLSDNRIGPMSALSEPPSEDASVADGATPERVMLGPHSPPVDSRRWLHPLFCALCLWAYLV